MLVAILALTSALPGLDNEKDHIVPEKDDQLVEFAHKILGGSEGLVTKSLPAPMKDGSARKKIKIGLEVVDDDADMDEFVQSTSRSRLTKGASCRRLLGSSNDCR